LHFAGIPAFTSRQQRNDCRFIDLPAYETHKKMRVRIRIRVKVKVRVRDTKE
jgi:hypothetical protein